MPLDPSLSRIAAIIPTANRPESLAECLRGLAVGTTRVKRVIVVDSSRDGKVAREAIVSSHARWPFILDYYDSPVAGAAVQRNMGLGKLNEEDGVLFVDDDAVMEPECLEEMLAAFALFPKVAGVAANICNQPVGPPGLATRVMLWGMGGGLGPTYSGRLIGPCLGMRPDHQVKERFIPIEWASTTCVLYRRSAMPPCGFRSYFTGYSLGEDVAFSVDARVNGILLYARDARIIHTPRSSSHPSHFEYGQMEVLNRWYLCREALHQRCCVDFVRFGGWLIWEFLQSLRSVGKHPSSWWRNGCGRWNAMWKILKGGRVS